MGMPWEEALAHRQLAEALGVDERSALGLDRDGHKRRAADLLASIGVVFPEEGAGADSGRAAGARGDPIAADSESEYLVLMIARPPAAASAVLGETEIDTAVDRVGPAADHHLGSGVEADAVGSVYGVVSEDRVLPTTERVEAQRDRDRVR